MPTLTNPRHELFAQELAKGKSQVEAYANAGYKPNRQHASRLVTNGDVVLRVAELLAIASQNTEITVESLMREAGDIQRAAFAAQQFSAANGALQAKAKLAGLWIDKAENDNTNRTVDPANLSDDKLADIASRDLAARQDAMTKAALDSTTREADEPLN